VSTFVSVGNAHQPFSRLLDQIEVISSSLPQPVVVQHGHTPFKSETCLARQFIGMSEFEHLINHADLVILHAGGGAVLQAVKSGKVPIIVPRRHQFGEHVDDHQVENARELALSGKVVVADNPQQLNHAIKKAIKLQLEVQATSAQSPMVGLVCNILESYAKDLI
jgi:UDP-N-acetylglucosamine transferase subunit ALG13